MLLKNGFIPRISTTYPVCGIDVGRQGEGWCFATKNETISSLDIVEMAKQLDLYEKPQKLKDMLDEHDKNLDRNKVDISND